MAMLADFKKFAFKGNVVDLAVGLVIGVAFGKIVSAVVADVVMPIVSLVMPEGDWRTAGLVIKHGATPATDTVIRYGDLVGTIIDFLVIAFVIFIVVSRILASKKAPAAPTTKECPECLGEIPIKAHRCMHCTSTFGGALAAAE